MLSKIKNLLRLLTKSKKRIILSLIILLLIIIASKQVFFSRTQEPEYQTAVVEKDSLITSITASGTISSANKVDIVSSATGVVKNVYATNGDKVVKGQKLADITLDLSGQQKNSQAWGSYLSAKSSLDSSQNSYNSLNSSMWAAQQKFINDAVERELKTDDPTYIQQYSDWLSAQNKYKSQPQVVAQAQISLNSAGLSYQSSAPQIVAPLDGVISNLTLAPGMIMTGSATLGSISLGEGHVQALVLLTEIDIPQIVEGQKVTLTLDAFPDKTFTGKVITIDTNGSVSSGVTQYPVIIDFDTADPKIYPNMGVSATIITSIKNDVLLIPSGAIQDQSGQSLVRLSKNGQITDIPVMVGDSNDTQTEITSGLSEGDMVVIGTMVSSGSSTSSSPFGARGFGALSSGGGSRGR